MNLAESKLFSAFKLGSLEMKNRVVMAPMTRCRAIGNTPNRLMANYYGQRATAGLIITEGTSPSPNGLGYARIPGIFNENQAAGWKLTTNAVHAQGGKIFIQLMHAGRVGHVSNLPGGAEVIAPSAIPAAGNMWTDMQGMQPMSIPRALETAEIPDLIAEYVHAAQLAMSAGFDGVEIHSANGYLPNQFLSPGSNQRTDQYGGNQENRNRFVLELTAAVADAIGKDKVGIRFSPFNKFNDILTDQHEADQYLKLARGIKHLGIAYMHLLTFSMPATLIPEMKQAFGGTTMLNGGYTAQRATDDIDSGKCELVSFGNTFISNPDLVHRMQTGAELVKADQATFYTADEKGYTDYATL